MVEPMAFMESKFEEHVYNKTNNYNKLLKYDNTSNQRKRNYASSKYQGFTQLRVNYLNKWA